MKSLVKILSLVAFFVISSVVFTATAFAADSVMMYGKTTPVLISGINNAGTIWFQNDGVTVYLANDANQQPKLIPDPSNPGGYKVEGWAWSDNLGWVSFSCRGGKNPPSTGAACGDQDYGVKIDATGTFHGYAWNDAMGYISMNSENHVPPALDGLGKPIVYGLKMDGVGRISGYAWSQSLGWLNFSGVYADTKITVAPNTNCSTGDYVGACCSVGPNPGSLDFNSFFKKMEPQLSNSVRVADGVDAYTVDLYFKDLDGSIIPKADFDSGKYEAKVIFKWEDTVKRDQTVAASGSNFGKISKPFQNSAGAVLYKPVFIHTGDDSFVVSNDINESDYAASKENINGATWNGNSPRFKITSVAPTTDGNLSRIVGSNKGFIENEDFSMFDNPPVTGLEDNKLALSSIEWAVKNTVTGQVIHGTSSFTVDGGTLKFKPALVVATLDGENYENTLWMYRNVPVGVKVGTENNKTNPDDTMIKAEYVTTLTDLFVEGSLQGKFETGFTATTTKAVLYINSLSDNIVSPVEKSNIQTFFSSLPVGQLNPLNLSLEATLASTDTNSLPGNYAEGAGLYSRVGYEAFVFIAGEGLKAKPVTYFSNHLPRTTAVGVTNPSVVITGTTYAQGNEVFSPQSGVNITGIGDQNVNIVRDLVYENIQKLLIGQSIPDHTEEAVTITSLNPECLTVNGCLTIELKNERIFYFNASNLIINNGETDIEPANKNTVIIVDGGDVHIESNLYTSNALKKKFKTGIVALRKAKLDEGNIYIGPDVTNIQALMIADGTLFSAKNYPFETNDFGEPDTLISPTEFNNQLLIEGGVSTRNCIGCVDSSASAFFLPTHGPLSKEGETDGVPNKDIAKRYDLNYLRYFSLELKYDPDTGEPVDQQEDGEEGFGTINPTASVADGGDLVLPDDALGAKGIGENKTNPVYIKYVPPSSDSFIFSKEKSLTF